MVWRVDNKKPRCQSLVAGSQPGLVVWPASKPARPVGPWTVRGQGPQEVAV